MAETKSHSYESLTKKGAKKIALTAAQLAAAGALLVSPEASATDTVEQQEISEAVTYEDKVEAAVDYQEAFVSVEYPLRLSAEDASLQPVALEELSEPIQEELQRLGQSTSGEREYYELTTHTQEPDELASSRSVFEEGRVTEKDGLSMTTVASGGFTGWALDQNGSIIDAIETVHLRDENNIDPVAGEVGVTLIVGLPEDNARVATYELHANVANRLRAEAYCEEDDEIVAGILIGSGQKPRVRMMEPFVIDAEGGNLQPRG